MEVYDHETVGKNRCVFFVAYFDLCWRKRGLRELLEVEEVGGGGGVERQETDFPNFPGLYMLTVLSCKASYLVHQGFLWVSHSNSTSQIAMLTC